MTEEEIERGLANVMAHLRHAYTHLAAERVIRQKELADGLLSPAIQRLEEIAAALDQHREGRAMQGEDEELTAMSKAAHRPFGSLEEVQRLASPPSKDRDK